MASPTLTNWERQKERYWLLTKGLITALFLVDRLAEGENLCSEVQAQISDPSILMTCAYLMAILYARFHKNERRDYHLARKWIQKSIEYVESLPEQEQTISNVNFLAKSTWALTELRAGHPYEAIKLLTEGLERLKTIDPEKYQHFQRDIETFLYNRARLYVETNQLERAIEDYTSAIELETYTTEYFFCRGNVLQRLGRYQEALADYNSAIIWSPPYPEVYYNRASVLAILGRNDQALADYTHVIELDPDSVDALINRASLLYAREEYPAARSDAEHALTLKPDDAQLLCVLGLLERAEHHTQEAHRVFSLALEHDPTLLAAWTNRAIVLFEEGNAEAAIDDLTHALSLCEDSTTLLNRAWIYRSQKPTGCATRFIAEQFLHRFPRD